MAYDLALADRIREQTWLNPRFTEKKMFGGIAFLLDGKMAVGVVKNLLMIRCRLSNYDLFLQQPFVREMDFPGKPLKGFLYIEPEGYDLDADLHFWIVEAIAFIDSKAS
jgi:TfoX/Sxy family transcriptional regulator of competence genes